MTNQSLKTTCPMLDPLPGADPAFEQLAARNDDLVAANEALADENERLRGAIRRARLYAGEHLIGTATAAGTGIVHILEKALRDSGQ